MFSKPVVIWNSPKRLLCLGLFFWFSFFCNLARERERVRAAVCPLLPALVAAAPPKSYGNIAVGFWNKKSSI